jgi:hypothetical protein
LTRTPNPENGIIEHNPKTGEPSGACAKRPSIS